MKAVWLLAAVGAVTAVVLVARVHRAGSTADPPVATKLDSPQAATSVKSGVRTLTFSGHEWWIKSSRGPVGPGPNVFSEDNVELDDAGRLHLRIVRRNGRWTCAEVVSRRSFGYGTYRFHVQSTEDLDPRIVLGLFTWDTEAAAHHHREIDIEISRWGDPTNQNGQCVVQPYTRPGNIVRFEMPAGRAIHEFSWAPQRVSCASRLVRSGSTEDGALVHRHTFTAGIPPAGGENARINLWLLSGQPPLSETEREVVVERFEFLPLRGMD